MAVLASVSGGASNPQPVEAAGRAAAQTVDPQAIRSVDFGNVAQPGSACSNGLRFSPPGEVPVVDGRSQVLDLAQLTQIVVDPNVAYSDLDGDGADEAVVHVTCSYGANGLEDTVEVYGVDGGDPVRLAAIDEPPSDLAGDLPPTVQGVDTSGGQVVVTWSQYADGDARCCPSEQAQVSYELADEDELAAVGDPVVGAAQP